jgi:hypothetical protein
MSAPSPHRSGEGATHISPGWVRLLHTSKEVGCRSVAREPRCSGQSHGRVAVCSKASHFGARQSARPGGSADGAVNSRTASSGSTVRERVGHTVPLALKGWSVVGQSARRIGPARRINGQPPSRMARFTPAHCPTIGESARFGPGDCPPFTGERSKCPYRRTITVSDGAGDKELHSTALPASARTHLPACPRGVPVKRRRGRAGMNCLQFMADIVWLRHQTPSPRPGRRPEEQLHAPEGVLERSGGMTKPPDRTYRFRGLRVPWDGCWPFSRVRGCPWTDGVPAEGDRQITRTEPACGPLGPVSISNSTR